MLRLRFLAPLLVAPLLVLAPAAAQPYPSLIPLPDNWNPEGIATAAHKFYAGSLVDGDIYRGDLRTGQGGVFIDVDGRQAVGLKADRRHGLLWVAGGGGVGYVYDLRTGTDVAALTLGAGFINDVVVTRSAAYFTNSSAPQIFRVPISGDGALGPVETITVTGPAAEPVVGGFGIGLNGIDAVASGRRLVVAHSDQRKLFTVDPGTGESAEIVLPPGSLGVVPDGILRQGRTVWVVQNFANVVSKVRVSPDWASGRVTKTVSNPAFVVPTTVARHGRRLVVVNAKFNTGITTFEAVQFKP